MANSTGFMHGDTSFQLLEDNDTSKLINIVRQGVDMEFFDAIASVSPFSLSEWSVLLHLSERTMLRIRKENRSFDPVQSEKILQIALLYKKGIDVFGNKVKFDNWLETENLALGQAKPKDLLDNVFGISLLNDELLRIEHGILA